MMYCVDCMHYCVSCWNYLTRVYLLWIVTLIRGVNSLSLALVAHTLAWVSRLDRFKGSSVIYIFCRLWAHVLHVVNRTISVRSLLELGKSDHQFPFSSWIIFAEISARTASGFSSGLIDGRRRLLSHFLFGWRMLSILVELPSLSTRTSHFAIPKSVRYFDTGTTGDLCFL